MSRKTKVIGFSLPPQINKKLESLLKTENKTRSEFPRGLIDTYSNTLKATNTQNIPLETKESDLASILNAYWITRSAQNETVMIIGLGIIQRPDGKILIGARKEKDEWVKNLSWVFPGGKMDSLDFDNQLKVKINKETNLNVTIGSLIASRIHPGSGFKNMQIVALYFYCKTDSKLSEKAGGGLKELKWIQPYEVFKYFTTSTSDDVSKFLITLDRTL